MAIKLSDPRNPILLEGLWTLGKTAFAQAYCGKYHYTFIPEPFHTHTHKSKEIKNLDAWYLNEHARRQRFLNEGRAVVVERSILSTFAFCYALKKPLPDDSYLFSLRELIQRKSVLVVYLKAEENLLPNKEGILQDYSDEIRRILLDKEAWRRYDKWYTDILPYEYGITPFVLRVSNNGVRRSMNQMIDDTHLVLACNRVAQVNVVCFHENTEGIRILVLKRNQKKGGFWQTITGGIHPGEGLLQTAQREVFEETRLGKGKASISEAHISYSFPGNDGYLLDEYVFAADVGDPAKIKISEEHEKFEWLDVGDAEQRVAYENNKTAIRAVYKKISSPDKELLTAR